MIRMSYLAYDRMAIDRVGRFDGYRPVGKETGIGLEKGEQSLGVNRFEHAWA